MKQLYAILTVAMLSVALCSYAQEQVQIRLVNSNGMELSSVTMVHVLSLLLLITGTVDWSLSLRHILIRRSI